MKSVFTSLVVGMFTLLASAQGATPVTFMAEASRPLSLHMNHDRVIAQLKGWVDLDSFVSVKIQTFLNAHGTPDHLLVYLHARDFHRVDFMKVNVAEDYSFTSVIRDYDPNAEAQLSDPTSAVCPDTSVQFISVAPHADRAIEVNTANDVAQAAQSAGLKTVTLLGSDATTANYVNYMSCPNLIGNFYDGDANKSAIETVDGLVTASQISTSLKGAFRAKVVNIWVACQAYNDPMMSAVIQDAQSQKYAAGVSDLLVGPSDRVGGCMMKAAIQGQSISDAYGSCRKQFDVTLIDKWGLGGVGSDQFGK